MRVVYVNMESSLILGSKSCTPFVDHPGQKCGVINKYVINM